MVRIWKRCARTSGLPLPPIVPVVLHHSNTGWTAARCLHAMIRFPPSAEAELHRLVPDFSFVLDDLSHFDDAQLRARAQGVFVELVLWSLRDARTPDRLFAHMTAWQDALRTLLAAESGQAAFHDILEYLSQVLPRADMERYEELVADLTGPSAEETMGTWATEVRREERAKGKAEGKAEGKADSVLRVVGARGLGVTDEQRARILACQDPELLDRWLVQAVTASSTAELFEH